MTQTIDMDKVMEFVGQFAGDLGATVSAGNVVLGDRLGLYRLWPRDPPPRATWPSAPGPTPVTSPSGSAARPPAATSSTTPPRTATRSPPRRPSPSPTRTARCSSPGRSSWPSARIAAVPRMEQAFKTGSGLGWHEHDTQVFTGCEKFFRPGYLAHLVGEWIPALDGAQAKLEQGAKVADIGCGHGASTVLMAEAFPVLVVRRLGLPRRLDRGGRQAGRRGRGLRAGELRGRGRAVLLRDRLRPGHQLRLPARHGRPAGRRAPRAQLRWRPTAPG